MKNETVFSASLFDELETLYPDTSCADGKETIETASASGGYAGVQIMLNDLTPGQAVIFDISVKNHPEKKLNSKLFSMDAVPVEFNTSGHDRTELIWGNEYNPDVIRRAPFLVYDILKPIINIEMVRYSSQAYTFRFLSAAEETTLTPVEIRITHCGISKTLTLLAWEYPVKIPPIGKNTHKYVNWFSLNNMAEYHHVEKWSPAFERILYTYDRAAAYTRQNMIAVSVGDYMEYGPDGTYVINEAHLDLILKTAEKAGMYWIEGGALTGRKNGEWCASEAEVGPEHRIIPGDGENVLRSIAKQLYAYIKKRGLEERWMQSVLDEPIGSLQNAYRIATAIVKEEMPGIPILEPTIGAEELTGTVNIWCPPLNIFEEQIDFFRHRVEAGDRIFVYTCLNPGGKFCNRLLDMEKLRQVYISWGSIVYPFVEGFLHWGGNQYCGRNPMEQTCMLFSQDDFDYTTDLSPILPAGDGFIFYPGPCGRVYSSVRAEAHRIGLEDLELLKCGIAKYKAYTEELVSRIFKSYHDYTTDIESYRSVKLQLLKFLSKT